MNKYIGKWFGLDIILTGNDPMFDEKVELIKKELSIHDEIWFDGYEDGHHPLFFSYNSARAAEVKR